jgi:hypothetical protein
MISNSVFESFYIADFEGDALQAFNLANFDIEKLSIASGKFETDLDALRALQYLMDFATEDLSFVGADIVSDFNPTFFPTLPKPALSDEQVLRQEELQEAAEKSETETTVAVVLTSLFDPMGDYIETRMTATAPKFKVMGRIGIDPDQYLSELGKAKAEEMNMFISARKENLTTSLH